MSEDSLESDDEDLVCFGRRTVPGNSTAERLNSGLIEATDSKGISAQEWSVAEGCFYFSDGSHLSGSFMDDVLEGKGIYTRDDGTQIISQYHKGELHEESMEYNTVGDVTFKGCYNDGTRDGFCIAYDEYNGAIAGNVASDGWLLQWRDHILYLWVSLMMA